MVQHICKNCGNQFQGKFCNNCGEKVYSDHDKSLRHFLDEIFHFFTHLDNRFFKTIAVILRRPGVLSVSYCSGVRNRYYKPVSLFFIGIVIYLLFPLFPGLNLSFNYNMINLETQHLDFFAGLAEKKAAAEHLSMAAFAEKYNHVSPVVAKLMLLIILPLTAIVLKILFARKRKYFFDYLILATEASSVFLYLNFLILPSILFVLSQLLQVFGLGALKQISDGITLPLFAIYSVFWNTTALKRFFEISTGKALLKGFLFLFLQCVVIFIIYRLILFLTVLLFI